MRPGYPPSLITSITKASVRPHPRPMSTPAPVPQLTKDHGKLVLTVALTGNLNTKEKNPNLPCSPQEIADDVHACAELGAVFFHIHARDENNKPTMHPHIFREICRLVKERDPDVIIQISTGGRAPPVGLDVDKNLWRINPLDLLPESGSFTPGSVNLEPIVYENSPQLVEMLAQKCAAAQAASPAQTLSRPLLAHPRRRGSPTLSALCVAGTTTPESSLRSSASTAI